MGSMREPAWPAPVRGPPCVVSHGMENAGFMDSSDSWLATEWLQDETSAEVCLVCLPHAGATHAVFEGWVRFFAPEIDIGAICLPGRGVRFGEPACDTMQELVGHLARALHDRPNRSPLAIYGECTGALIATALVNELAKTYGEKVVHLFVAGYPPPGHTSRKLHALAPDAFRDEVLGLGFIPPELAANPQTIEFFLPQILADFRICELFEGADLLLDCPITGLIGTEDRLDPVVFERWAGVTRGPWNCVTVPYGHLLAADPKCVVRPAVKRSVLDRH